MNMKTWAIIRTVHGIENDPGETEFDYFASKGVAVKTAEKATKKLLKSKDYDEGDGYAVLGFDKNSDCDDSYVADFYIDDGQVYDRVYRRAWGAEG